MESEHRVRLLVMLIAYFSNFLPGLFTSTSTQAATAQTSAVDEQTKLLFAVHDPQLPVTEKEKATIKRWNQLQVRLDH